MRHRIQQQDGTVVELEGTPEEVAAFLRQQGGRQAPRLQARVIRQNTFDGYDSAGALPADVLEGVVVESTPGHALQATPQGPISLVDESELQRYLRSGWE